MSILRRVFHRLNRYLAYIFSYYLVSSLALNIALQIDLFTSPAYPHKYTDNPLKVFWYSFI